MGLAPTTLQPHRRHVIRPCSFVPCSLFVLAGIMEVGGGYPIGLWLRDGRAFVLGALGVVAMLEIARSLRQGPPPKRTVVLIAFTGEEMGGLGNRHYLANPVVSLERTVAQLQISCRFSSLRPTGARLTACPHGIVRERCGHARD